MHAHFQNRKDAGRKLARALESYRSGETVAIGLPRGGVVLAFEVAQALGAPLDVIVARKIGAPDCPEFGIGSVAPCGIRYLDERVIRQLDISPEILDRLTCQARDEVVRRMELYRGSQRMPDLKGKIAILVDDGLATGVTARVAIRSARQAGAVRVILAIPVAPSQSVKTFQGIADEVVCLERPEVFRAVGCWYEDFEQTTDEEVLSLLRHAGGPLFRKKSEVSIPVESGSKAIDAFLSIPDLPKGLVIFAHGSGSSRHSSRNQQVARRLNDAGFATLLLDLLTAGEESVDRRTREYRFDIPLLARRVIEGMRWVADQKEISGLAIGLFGASTGAAAALTAAAECPGVVSSVVSRGGRPDLAENHLERVRAPTLLIVGSLDPEVLELNRQAMERIPAEKHLEIIGGATHLFEEPGTLDAAAGAAIDWFTRHQA